MVKRNLFIIGRRRGAEDQLTEMLAYLWERNAHLIPRWLKTLRALDAPVDGWKVETQVTVPGAGRLDLTLEVPGVAFIILESKLGAELTDEQIFRYIGYAAKRTEPLRAVVTLTQQSAALGGEVRRFAEASEVILHQARWQDLGEAIVEPAANGEAGDFVRMLIKEGIVVPQAITAADLAAWNAGAAVLARIKELLSEARAGISELSPGLTPTGRWASDERWLSTSFTSERLEFGVGFAANESRRRLDSPSIVFAYAKNLQLPRGESAAAAAQAAARVAGGTQMWSSYAAVTAPAERLLTAPAFRDQLRDVIAFARRTLLALQEVGYLPCDMVTDPSSDDTPDVSPGPV